MAQLIVEQSMNLKGEINISGAKNSALVVMCASLLSDDDLILKNVPHLHDINTLQKVLHSLGVTTSFANNTMVLNARNISNLTADYELVRTMRASILVLGPLLAKHKEAIVSLPGGCAIGARPVDQHIKGLKAMGAEIIIENGYIHAKTDGLKGAKVVFDVITVTGTENILMAAVLADGETILENAAIEPEVTDLANCLVQMGAKISGIGSNVITVQGVKQLHGAEYNVMPDRIETGSFAVAAAITQGDLVLRKTNPHLLTTVLDKLTEIGAIIQTGADYIHIYMSTKPKPFDIVTKPFPCFPTDLQAQFMALATVAEGSSLFHETIFENRYMHASELTRMGANIEVHGSYAKVHGVEQLHGAPVMATDLRASMSLILAGLCAEGTTIIDRIYHLDRGYENIEHKLGNVGAKITRKTLDK